MNHSPDVELVLREYLAEDGLTAPDHVLHVVERRISRQRQPRARRLSWRLAMNPLVKLGAAVAAVLLVAIAASALPQWLDRSTGDSSPSTTDESGLDAADLPLIVVADSTVPDGLTVVRMLSGDDAVRASQLVAVDQSGVVDARLVTLIRPADDEPNSVGHPFEAPSAARYLELNGEYGSLAIVFETTADAESAAEVAAATLMAPNGWGLEVETAPAFTSDDWVPAGGVRYVQGSDYGYPIVRAYLWRIDNSLMFAVDFHVYDLPGVLQSMVEDMDARARSLAGQG